MRDVRFDHPAGWHRFAQLPVSVWPGGDVLARARVRWLETQRSGAFVEEQLGEPPDGDDPTHHRGPLAPDTPGRRRWWRAGAARSATSR